MSLSHIGVSLALSLKPIFKKLIKKKFPVRILKEGKVSLFSFFGGWWLGYEELYF